MDILKTLNEQGNNLLPEDLDYLETELDTAKDYSERYKQICKKKIEQLRKGRNGSNDKKSGGQSDVFGIPLSLMVPAGNLSPDKAKPMSPDQVIMRKISDIRLMEEYRQYFKAIITENKEIDSSFIDRHFSFFYGWELDTILMEKQLGEEILEKYFGALDRKKIARYQLFSEEFFMKHFAQFDYAVVLQHGKNSWRKKENRSQKLDVFLRLKGVTI